MKKAHVGKQINYFILKWYAQRVFYERIVSELLKKKIMLRE